MLKKIAVIVVLMVSLGVGHVLYVWQSTRLVGEWVLAYDEAPLHEELSYDFTTLQVYKDGTFAWSGEIAGTWEKYMEYGVCIYAPVLVVFPDGSSVGLGRQYRFSVESVHEGETYYGSFVVAAQNGSLVLVETHNPFGLSYELQ